MAQYRRCKEKFHSAIYHLAVGKGDVRDRLRDAYKELRVLSGRDVPLHLRKELESVRSALTKYGPEVDSDGTFYRKSVDHTLSKIRNSTGQKIAMRIWALAQELA